MECTIERVDAEALPLYATIPISFTVSSAFRVEAVDGGLGGFALIEEPVTEPYVKWTHHDQGDDPDPLLWPREFDVSHWGFFLALEAGRPAGGSVVAVDTPAVHMLENRPDLAVLWDIRVRPDLRRHGLGTRLFQAAAEFSRQSGCTQLKIEAQNVNVPACRFYASQGCELGAVHRYFYAAVPAVAHETALFWYLTL